MNGFQVGDADGGLTWLSPAPLSTDMTPAALFGLDTSMLPLAGPNATVEWAGGAK
ncbi:hypothetical protein [Lentzea sp. NPDC060358]|uniref:hypothetical protein n=1 Tax=Lentzea sp. NPDC060358 TaxID=3347103 RepID=UPI00364F7971